jgi:glucosamine--fructose-6-phosphate aminotransferase (isomerizing)
MCGIVGATGSTDTLELLLEGISRLEYRGYDSAGVVLESPGELWRVRVADGTRSLDALRKLVGDAPAHTPAGIGHTRWATHGKPTEANAHPHMDCTGQVAVVHNGIIDNWQALATRLENTGHELTSQTDTEVLAHLIEEEITRGAGFLDAVRGALGQVEGSFAIAVLWTEEPGTIVAASRLSPLVVAFGETPGPSGVPEALLASDTCALLGRTHAYWALEDDEVAVLRPGSIEITTLAGTPVDGVLRKIDWDLEAAQKGGFEDFMSKEMHEQPRAVADTLLGRLLPDGSLTLDETRISADELREVEKVIIVACGSSYHAGLVAKYAIEHWARLPTEVDIASEFRGRDPILDTRTLVVGISQSGETVDTLKAMRKAEEQRAKVLVISNVVQSSMARRAEGVLYTRAGPEVGVAATKTHLAQLVALQILALYLAQLRGTLFPAEVHRLFESLEDLPALLEQVLSRGDAVAEVARAYGGVRDFFFLGRHVGYPVAMEGALKLKEIAYLRAEAYPAGELKHGPIALIEPGTAVVGVATRNPLQGKMLSNIAEVRSRGARVLLLVNDGDEETARSADDVLWVPSTGNELFSPVLDVVPLQFFAYHLARLHGLDVDRPRNLAKTVTVE